MKRFKPLWAILLVALVLVPFKAEIVAQEPPDTTELGRAFFIGARSVEGERVSSYGVGLQLSPHFWLFNINDYGIYGSVAVEVALLYSSGRFAFGPIAGINADQVPVDTEPDPVTYLLGASGGLITAEIATIADRRIGGWAYYKWKVPFGEQDEYKVDHNFGAGIFILFGPQ